MGLFGDPAQFLVGTAFLLPALLLGFVLHEMAHAYVAVSQGDETPRFDGRLSPDPRRHIDPLGLIMVLLFRFGYARPVRVNHSRMRHEYSALLVALAGPFTNLLIAVAASIPLRLVAGGDVSRFFLAPCSLTANLADVLTTALLYIYTLNLILMVFNLLPLPPLDGFELVRTALRRNNPRLLFQVESNQQMITLGFFAVLFFLPGVLSHILQFVVGPIAILLGVPLNFPCG